MSNDYDEYGRKFVIRDPNATPAPPKHIDIRVSYKNFLKIEKVRENMEVNSNHTREYTIDDALESVLWGVY